MANVSQSFALSIYADRVDNVDSSIFALPNSFKACTINGMVFPLYAKFRGAACLNIIILFLIGIFLEDPVVRYETIIGTCVDRPKIFAAVLPVGIIST